MGNENLFTFLLGTVIVLAVPGPSVLFVVARTLQGGRPAGLVSVAGLETGLAVHVAAATVGLSAVVASSDNAMTALRYIGSGYLAVLAGRQLRTAKAVTVASTEAPTVADTVAVDRWSLFREAFVVDALNPKTGLFFLAFLPQFVDSHGPPAAAQVLVLGVLVVGVAMICDVSYVVASSLIAGRCGREDRGGAGVAPGTAARTTSAVYAGLAVIAVVG